MPLSVLATRAVWAQSGDGEVLLCERLPLCATLPKLDMHECSKSPIPRLTLEVSVMPSDPAGEVWQRCISPAEGGLVVCQ